MSKYGKCSSSKVSNQLTIDKTKPFDEQIEQLCMKKCTHQDYCYSGNKTSVCDLLCNTINECYAYDGVLSDKAIELFLNYICAKSQYTYWNQRCCCIMNKSKLSNVLSLLFNQYFPKRELFNILIEIIQYDQCYYSFSSNPNFTTFPEQYIDTIIEKRLEFSCSDTDNSLANLLIKHTEITKENIFKLCGCMNYSISAQLASIIDKFADTFDDSFLVKACNGLPYTRQTIEALLNRGLQLNKNHLVIVCSKCDVQSIEYILQKSRISITKEHFQAIITSRHYNKETKVIKNPKQDDESSDDQDYSFRYGKNNKKTVSGYINGYSNEKSELLIKYGYIPDYSDIEFGIKNKVEIYGIERFDIVLDKKLLELCWDNDFYPQYKFDCIQPEMVELQKICKTRKLAELKKIIKTHSLVPDRKCMENAACFKTNLQAYKILCDAGGKITYLCIKNCASQLNNNYYLVQLVNDFESIYNNNNKEYQNKITELEKQITELGGTVIPFVLTQIPNKIITVINKSTIEDDNISSFDDISDEEQSNISSSSHSQEEVKSKPDNRNIGKAPILKNNKVNKKQIEKKPISKNTLAKIKAKNIEVVDDDDDMDINDNDDSNNVLILNIDNIKIATIQKQYRLKSIPPSKIIEIFKVPKTIKMSYADVKKYVLDKIKTENWIDTNDKNLLNIPNNIREKMGLNKTGSVSFNDIDKLICMFYI